jgi:hypothetical protein
VQVAVGFALFCVLLEVLVTLVLGEQVKFPRHVVDGGFGLRINQPGARYRHESADVDVEFRINGQGMRDDREHAYAKPAGRKRIVSLGDSFTAGYEVQAEESFSAVLERELRARGHDVEVLNAGVSGYGNAEACLYLERELFKYDPDVVVISFFNNDLVDNVRSNLFALRDGRLVPAADSYVPLGDLGDFLNTNWLFNVLSERSNAFALLKEQANLFLKRKAVAENEANLDPGSSDERLAYQRRLAAAILDRLYAETSARGAALVVQSIPLHRPTAQGAMLVDAFPLEEFDVQRPGLSYLPASSFLGPHLGLQPLYHLRSHMHWTPLSHRLSGQALAEVIDAQRLLD